MFKTRNFKHVCGQERKMSKEVQPASGKATTERNIHFCIFLGTFKIQVNIYKEGNLQHGLAAKECLTVLFPSFSNLNTLTKSK